MDNQPEDDILVENYVTVKFVDIGVGSFFMYGGKPCLKTSNTEAIMAQPLLGSVKNLKIGEDIPSDHTMELCDYYFSYVRKADYDARKDSREGK